jgi:predicted 3-demethylubiquinone-9 3-methyltransferase (glyoxalase superfamily)
MITITPFLWYVDNADAAIQRYLTVFDDTRLVEEVRGPDGALFIGVIELQGQRLTLMNGGPDHHLTDAFSLAISVQTQEEVDSITARLIDGGGAQGRCGWLVDAFGLSWQVVPEALPRLMGDPDPEKAGRVREALMTMSKIEIQQLQDAYDGREPARL